jgi:hypothetical protein
MASKLTKLSAVNIVLSNIGMAPVTRVDNDNPMVVMAANLIDEVSRSVQTEGWVFNTERDYPFTPSPNNEILVPDNVLELDSDEYQKDNLIIRSGKLYNKSTHSYKFTEQINLDVLWLFDYDDIPEAFKNYIAVRAANLFAGRAVGSAEQVKFGEREEATARAAMIDYETSQGDYNMLSNTDLRNYNYYRPYMGVLRY